MEKKAIYSFLIIFFIVASISAVIFSQGIYPLGTNSSNSNDVEQTNDPFPCHTFEEWKHFLLEHNNLTTEDLKIFPPKLIESINKEVRIYQGWSNGTYSDDEKSNLLNELHNTPLMHFTNPLLAWPQLGVDLFAFNDANFHILFWIDNVESFEHIFRVYAYLDFDRTDTDFSNDNEFYDGKTEKVYGPCLLGDCKDPYSSDLNPKESFMGSARKKILNVNSKQVLPSLLYEAQGTPGRVEDEIYFIVQVLYRWDEWVVVGWINHFKWKTYYTSQYQYFPLIYYDLNIYDDDSSPPMIDQLNYANSIPDSYDSLKVTLKASDSSGIDRVYADFRDSTYYGTYSNDQYYIYIPNPRLPGDYFATITVWDNDEDRSNDQLSTTRSLDFSVYDDDTSPPAIHQLNYNPNPSDGDSFLPVSLSVSDQSGIDMIYADFNGSRYYASYSEGYYYFDLPNPQALGFYVAYLTIVDNDKDRTGDQLATTTIINFKVSDDDIDPPVINQLTYDSIIFDSVEYLMVRLSVSDKSGIDQVYAYFEGTKYYGSLMGGFYYINIPNPRSLGNYFVPVYIIDNDKDRPGDQLTTTTSIIFEVIDDDISPPIIQEILYDSTILDNTEHLLIKVSATDDSGIAGINALFNGKFYYGILKNNYFEITIPNPEVPGDYSMLILVMDNDLDRPGDQLMSSQSIQFSVIDDDITGPLITIIYTGDALDGNSGFWTVSVSDPESGIDSIIVKIDGIQVGTSAGEYIVPNSLGLHIISVIAKNADLDSGPNDQETNSDSDSVIIADDDPTGPEISITYTGDGLDSNAGFWTVFIDDPESGIGTITVQIDGIQVGTSIGDYAVSNILGSHTISVIAKNADLDSGPNDQETSSDSNSVIIADDDPTGPEISITYTGDGLDSNAGFWTVFIDDPESGIGTITVQIDGIQVGTSIGDYAVSNILGSHIISVSATNMDQDRGHEDQETSTDSEIVTIKDDDISPPNVEITIGITEPTSYGVVVPIDIQSIDESGIANVYIEIEDYIFKTLGTHYVVLVPGTYLLKVWVTDADNDRPADDLTAYQEIPVEIVDLWPPITELIVEDYYESSEGEIYVNFNSIFTLSAKDDYSKVAHTYYRINGGDWIEYSDSFSLNLALDTYFIEYYSVDTEGNEETPKSLTFLFEEIYKGYGFVRFCKKCYCGEAKLYLSENLIRMELCQQSIEWEIKKAWKCRKFEIYFGCGEFGKIVVKVCRCNIHSCLMAVGRKIFFLGILEEMPEPEEPPPELPM